MDLNLYRAFVVAVDRGSITAAASVLGLSRPTLSRQLAALEAATGLALLLRSTRKVQPTPAGRALYQRVAPLVSELLGALSGVAEERDDVTGTLRVSVPPVIATELGVVLLSLRAKHPRLAVELLADERFADLREDGVEIAVRGARSGRVGGDRELNRLRLGAREVGAYASPAYLARRGRVSSRAALASHVVLLGADPKGVAQRTWPTRDGGRVTLPAGFSCNDQRTLVSLALEGAGIALISEVSAQRPVSEGLLEPVLPGEIGAELVLHALYHPRARQPARVRVALEALSRWAAAFARGPRA